MKSPQSKCKLPFISLSKKCGTLKVNSLHSLKDKIVPSSESYSNLSSYSVILNRPLSHKLKNRKWSMQSESTANSLSKPKSSEIEDVYECENELNISNLSDFNLEEEDDKNISFDSSFDKVETVHFDEEELM